MTQSVPLQMVGAGLAHVLSDVLQYASQTVVAGTLRTLYLGLFTAWNGFALALKMAGITEANYSGYARQQVVWGDEGVDTNQRPQVFGGALQFVPTDNLSSNTVIGVFANDSLTAGNLIAVGLLTSSFVMSTTLNVLTVLPRFAVPGLAAPDWGEIVGIN